MADAMYGGHALRQLRRAAQQRMHGLLPRHPEMAAMAEWTAARAEASELNMKLGGGGRDETLRV
jgi:hypothetical protein